MEGNKFDVKRHISIPFIRGLSGNVCRTLKNTGLNPVYTIPKKLDTLIKKGKDKLHNKNKTEVVYRIDCNNCNATYVGQTKRHLSTRIKEHKNDIKKNESNYSVVSQHRLLQNHEFNWSNPKILHKERNLKKREIAEMIFIKNDLNAINLKRDTENLNLMYDYVLKSL